MFKGQQLSLKQGLLLVVLAALLPIGVVSVIQSMTNWEGMQRSAMAALAANARAVAERERDAFLVSSRLLIVASANPDIRSMAPNCSTVLKTGFRGYDRIINFLRTDASGTPRCSILPIPPGLNVLEEQWWQETKNATAVTISRPTIGPVARMPIIIMAIPLRNQQGEFTGTFSAGLDISRLEKSIKDAPEAKNGFIAVVSREGDLVASNAAEAPFRLPTRIGKSRSGTVQSDNGEEWVYETVRLGGDALYVLYAEPRKRILSSALAQVRASIILPLVGICLTMFAIWFGTNRLVVRWLDKLRALSTDITKGKFSDNRDAFASAPLELKALGDDLHDMAGVIQSRTTDLTDALAAKTELTREVHHRVKNNLQIVTSLLTMQASRMNDDAAQTALQQSRARIVALALIHRLTYEQDSLGAQPEVTVDVLMIELCKQLRYSHRTRNKIHLDCKADDYSLQVDLAVPFALFIVEAVTNSFRHAFPDNNDGRIDLSFVKKDREAVLTISDNGTGYDVGQAVGRELGTELMRGFAGQLGGQVEFTSNQGAGSTTILRFPIQEHAAI